MAIVLYPYVYLTSRALFGVPERAHPGRPHPRRLALAAVPAHRPADGAPGPRRRPDARPARDAERHRRQRISRRALADASRSTRPGSTAAVARARRRSPASCCRGDRPDRRSRARLRARRFALPAARPPRAAGRLPRGPGACRRPRLRPAGPARRGAADRLPRQRVSEPRAVAQIDAALLRPPRQRRASLPAAAHRRARARHRRGRPARPRTWLPGLARLASLGYALPGTVLALGLLVPLVAFDDALNAIMAGVRRSNGFGLVLIGSGAAMVIAYTIRFLAIALRLPRGRPRAGLGRLLDDAARTLGGGRADGQRVQLPARPAGDRGARRCSSSSIA